VQWFGATVSNLAAWLIGICVLLFVIGALTGLVSLADLLAIVRRALGLGS
jgi:hypothetical protein